MSSRRERLRSEQGDSQKPTGAERRRLYAQMADENREDGVPRVADVIKKIHSVPDEAGRRGGNTSIMKGDTSGITEVDVDATLAFIRGAKPALRTGTRVTKPQPGRK